MFRSISNIYIEFVRICNDFLTYYPSYELSNITIVDGILGVIMRSKILLSPDCSRRETPVGVIELQKCRKARVAITYRKWNRTNSGSSTEGEADVNPTTMMVCTSYDSQYDPCTYERTLDDRDTLHSSIQLLK